MRVTFNTIDEFCDELDQYPELVVDGIVRYRIDRTAEQPEALSFSVVFWATAVVKGSSFDTLYEFGADAGCDQNASDAGSDQAGVWLDRLKKTVDDSAGKLNLRHGKIELY